MRGLACILVVFLVLAALPGAAQGAEWKLTLEQSVQRALEENRDIAIARERLSEVIGMKGEARAQGLPQLTAVAGYTRTWRRPEMIINGVGVQIGSENYFHGGGEFSQLLFDGGRVVKAVRAARTEELRGIETIRDAEEMVRFQVKQTYYQILYMEKVIDVLERQLQTLKGHLGAIQTRYAKGIDSDYAVMRQQVEVANVEPELIEARRVKDLLLTSLKILLAIPPEEAFVPVERFAYQARPTPAAAELSAMARSHRPDLAAEKLREQSLVQNVGVEKAGYWPTINFTTSWQWQGYSGDWNLTANEQTDAFQSGLGLSWPIFDGLKTASRVRQAKAKLLQQHYQAMQKEDSVVKEVADARVSLERAQQALATQRTSYATARRATSIAGERFEAGLMSQIELNDTIMQQAKAEQLYLQATLDCLTAEASLEKAVGGALWDGQQPSQSSSE